MNEQIRIDHYDQIQPLIAFMEGHIKCVVYAEVLSSKGKPKKCIIVCSFFGIHVLRNSMLSRNYRIKNTITIYDIFAVTYQSDLTRRISFKGGDLIITSKDISYLQDGLVYIKSALSQDIKKCLPLELANYPTDKKPTYPIKVENIPSITAIRYMTLATYYGVQPDEGLINIFSKYALSRHTLFILDSTIRPPEHPMTIIKTLSFEENLSTLILDNFAPNCIGHILRKCLIHIKNLKNIILRNYSTIQLDLLNIATIKDPGVVSFTFDNCISQNDFEEFSYFWMIFSQYTGNIQSITIKNTKITLRTAERIQYGLINSRCFRLLENIVLKNIICSKKTSMKVCAQIQDALSALHCIRRIEMSDWSPPILFPKVPAGVPFRLIKTQEAAAIHFGGADLSNVLGRIHFPESICELSFPQCVFSVGSLCGLLNAIRGISNNILLDLSGLRMSEEDFNIFYDRIKRMESFSNITELRYNENLMNFDFAKEFCRIFISENLRFLSLNGVFGVTDTQTMALVFTALIPTKIWGFEIRGSATDPSRRMKEKTLMVSKLFRKVHSLRFIDISDHDFPDNVSMDVLKALLLNKLLHEIVVDGTAMTKDVMFAFYLNLLNHPGIKTFGEPVKDVSRIASTDTLKNILGSDPYIKLRARIASMSQPSVPMIRAFYYEKSIDMTKFAKFRSSFPRYFIDRGNPDILFLGSPLMESNQIRSLMDVGSTDPYLKVVNSKLRSPFMTPDKSPSSAEITIPLNLRKLLGKTLNITGKIANITKESQPKNDKLIIEAPQLSSDSIEEFGSSDSNSNQKDSSEYYSSNNSDLEAVNLKRSPIQKKRKSSSDEEEKFFFFNQKESDNGRQSSNHRPRSEIKVFQKDHSSSSGLSPRLSLNSAENNIREFMENDPIIASSKVQPLGSTTNESKNNEMFFPPELNSQLGESVRIPIPPPIIKKRKESLSSATMPRSGDDYLSSSSKVPIATSREDIVVTIPPIDPPKPIIKVEEESEAEIEDEEYEEEDNEEEEEEEDRDETHLSNTARIGTHTTPLTLPNLRNIEELKLSDSGNEVESHSDSYQSDKVNTPKSKPSPMNSQILRNIQIPSISIAEPQHSNLESTSSVDSLINSNRLAPILSLAPLSSSNQTSLSFLIAEKPEIPTPLSSNLSKDNLVPRISLPKVPTAPKIKDSEILSTPKRMKSHKITKSSSVPLSPKDEKKQARKGSRSSKSSKYSSKKVKIVKKRKKPVLEESEDSDPFDEWLMSDRSLFSDRKVEAPKIAKDVLITKVPFDLLIEEKFTFRQKVGLFVEPAVINTQPARVSPPPLPEILTKKP